MMSLVDDATSTTLLRFGAEETIWAAVAVLKAWIAAYGVPRELYTDWKNVYKRAPTLNERSRGEPAYTQFGRMCQKLDVEIIGAASPQAKGRIERSHGTHQDRLIKKMRLLGLADDAAANAYVAATYLPQHNARFAVLPASPVDHHRVRDRRRYDDDIFCLEESRIVGQDYVVQYHAQALQLARAARGRVPAKSTVLVRETEEGRVRVIHVARDGHERECQWTTTVARAAAPTPVRASGTRGAIVVPPAPHRPAPDHPWRAQHDRWQAIAVARRAEVTPKPG